MRKPFWRTQYKCWCYKTKAGKFIRLDPDADKAETMFAELLATGCDRGKLATIQGITEAFLEEHEPLLSANANYQAKNYGFQFVDSLPPGTLVSERKFGCHFALI